MRTRIVSCLTGLTMLLTGCGDTTTGAFAFTAIREVLAARQPQEDLRAGLTPAAVQAIGRPVLLIELPERQAQALVVELSRNGDTVTSISPDGVGVTLKDGVVLSTRGLGGDLMVADVNEALAGIRGQRGEGLRVHRYLNGENQTVARAMICDYSQGGTGPVEMVFGSRTARIVTESCTGPDWNFENLYWLDGSGQIIKSEQWIGPDIGTLTYEVLTSR